MLDAMGLKTGIDLDKLLQVRDIVTAALPGEPMTIKIIKPGEESDQGIGYLGEVIQAPE